MHAVYFWLKDAISEAQLRDFAQAVKGLTTLATVVRGGVGSPVPGSTAL